MNVARLIPPVHEEGIPYIGRYSVSFEGEIIVKGSRVAEMDAARLLLSRGITGKIIFLDADTGKERFTCDIEKTAKLTIEENNRNGPRLVKWRPMPETAHQRSGGSPPMGEDCIVLPTMPPEANEAA